MVSDVDTRSANRALPDRTPRGKSVERWLGIPFNLLERAGYYAIVRPSQWALRWQRE